MGAHKTLIDARWDWSSAIEWAGGPSQLAIVLGVDHASLSTMMLTPFDEVDKPSSIRMAITRSYIYAPRRSTMPPPWPKIAEESGGVRRLANILRVNKTRLYEIAKMECKPKGITRARLYVLCKILGVPAPEVLG